MRRWIAGIAGIGLLALAVYCVRAQVDGARAQSPEQRMRERGPGGPGGADRPPLSPDLLILWALDTNSDGELSAEEIANAAVSLKRLDKNGDGKVSRQELRLPLSGGDPQGRNDGPDGGDGRPPRRPGQDQGRAGEGDNRPPPPPAD